jgi:L-malate glycosyltransferase
VSIHRIIIAGPATPHALSDLLCDDAERVRSLPGLGGSPVVDQVRLLHQSGYEVDLVTLDPSICDPLRLRGPGLTIRVGPYRPRARERVRDLFRAERHAVRRLVDDARGDVVHAHWTYEFALGALDSRHRSVVVTSHDAPLRVLRQQTDPYRLVRTAMAFMVSRKTRHLMAVSPHVRDHWQHQLRYRGHVSVVPNAVIPPSDALSLSATRPPRDTLVVAAGLGHWTRLKNPTTLLRAFARLRSLHVNGCSIQLRLYGTDYGPKGIAASAAGRLALSQGVVFRGALDRTRFWTELREADILAHTSREEACSMVVAEAMSTGVPVVAGSRSGGIPWQLDFGRSGLLVDTEDVEAVSAALWTLISDGALRRELSARALQRAHRLFSASSVLSSWMENYEQCSRELV